MGKEWDVKVPVNQPISPRVATVSHWVWASWRRTPTPKALGCLTMALNDSEQWRSHLLPRRGLKAILEPLNDSWHLSLLTDHSINLAPPKNQIHEGAEMILLLSYHMGELPEHFWLSVTRKLNYVFHSLVKHESSGGTPCDPRIHDCADSKKLFVAFFVVCCESLR